MSFIQYLTPTAQEIVDQEKEEVYEIATGGGPVTIGKAVCFDAAGGSIIKVADTRDSDCKGMFAGVALQNGVDGEFINIQSFGEYEDNSFNFPASAVGGKVYYDFNGDITHDLSTIESDGLSDHYQIIGKVLSNKKILIKEEPAVTK